MMVDLSKNTTIFFGFEREWFYYGKFTGHMAICFCGIYFAISSEKLK